MQLLRLVISIVIFFKGTLTQDVVTVTDTDGSNNNTVIDNTPTVDNGITPTPAVTDDTNTFQDTSTPNTDGIPITSDTTTTPTDITTSSDPILPSISSTLSILSSTLFSSTLDTSLISSSSSIVSSSSRSSSTFSSIKSSSTLLLPSSSTSSSISSTISSSRPSLPPVTSSSSSSSISSSVYIPPTTSSSSSSSSSSSVYIISTSSSTSSSFSFSSSSFSSSSRSIQRTKSLYANTSSSTTSSSSSSSSRSSITSSSIDITTIASDRKRTLTSVVEGKTVLSNYYTTITLMPSSTSKPNSKSHKNDSLSKKDRNIVLGCCLGIGIPLVLITALFIYVTCIRSKKIDFIDSDGKVVSTYKMNKFKLFWLFLMGKSINSIDNNPDDNHSNTFNEKNIIHDTSNSPELFDNSSSQLSNNSLMDSQLSDHQQNYQSFFNEGPFDSNEQYYNFTHPQENSPDNEIINEQFDDGSYSDSISDSPRVLNIANPS